MINWGKEYEPLLQEIKEIADKLRSPGDLSFMRDQALAKWHSDLKGGDQVARAWLFGALMVLKKHGYEVKKKE